GDRRRCPKNRRIGPLDADELTHSLERAVGRMFCYVVERRVWSRILWVAAGLGLLWGAYVYGFQPGAKQSAGSPVVAEGGEQSDQAFPTDDGENVAPAIVTPPRNVSIRLDDV